MTIFRWVLGVVAVLLAAAALFGLTLGIVFDSTIWFERTRRLRRWIWLIALFWFNVEIWGRVGYTLIHWNG